MHVITCVLVLWMHALTFVKSQNCTLTQFLNGPKYDLNFDTTDLEDTYLGGKQVRVGCNVGHSGFFKMICVEGKWQYRGTKCQPKLCGHPGDAEFADFHLEKGDDFVFGSQVVYTCHKGYQMVSRTNYRHCLAEGWDGVVPVCEAQQCPVIHVDNNVHVIGDPEEANYGNVVRFSCKSNSQILKGLSEIYCDENGVWSGVAPKCEDVTCTVPVIENGYVPEREQRREYKEHDVLYFLCNPKYKQSEDRSSKCTKVGIRSDWSPTPLCEPISCKLMLPAVEGTRYEPAFRSLFTPGDTVRVICGDKYWVSTPQDTLAVSTCQDNGEWDIRPVCQEVTCRNQRHRHMSYWYVYWGQRMTLGETVSFNCKPGYKRTDGATRVTCTRDGWSPDPPCQEITCNIKRFQHADIDRRKSEYKSEYKFNEQVEYVCKDGYEGRFTLTCGETDWIGNSQCREITCNIKRFQHADIDRRKSEYKSEYKFNEQVEYVCKDGYEGRFTLTCGETDWIGNPQCREITCNIKRFQHADIDRRKSEYKSEYKFNEQVEYVCKDGYEGRFTLTCGETDWIGNSQCRGTGCEKLDISNAYIIRNDKESYSHNERVRYTCRNDNDRQFTITCVQGVWTGIQSCEDTPACPKVEVEHGFAVELNGRLYYACKDGFKPVTKGWWREVKCNDHVWSEIPKCIDKNMCGEMPVIPNMEVKSEHHVNGKQQQTIEIICKEGYRAQVDYVTCQRGNWYGGGLPLKDICKPVENHCKPPIKVENAVVESAFQKEYLSGSQVTYRCRNNYTMEAEDTIKCTDGNWEKKDIKCTSRFDKPKDEQGAMTLSRDKEGYIHEGVITHECITSGEKTGGNTTCVHG